MTRNKLLDTAIDLIKIPSVSSDLENLTNIIDYTQWFFQSYDNVYIKRFVFNHKPSIIISNHNLKWADIVLSWHVDVVPESEEWQFSPFIKWNKLYWRWAADMKSWVAIMMHLMKKILDENYKEKNISLILTSDEEVWWTDWAWALAEQGYWWDFVMIPDGWSSKDLVVSQKWLVLFEVEWKWKSCHWSRPWLWDNSIDNIFKYYNLLKSYFEDPKKVYWAWNWWTTVNINMINWGKTINMVPDSVTANFDIRFTSDFSDQQVFDKIHEFAEYSSCYIKKYIFWSSLYTSENDEDIIKFKNIVKEVVWTEEVFLTKEHWWSDWRFFSQKWSKVILQRPDCWNLHSKNEWVNIDSISLVYQTYLNFIKS